ncbi:hypothetical protein F5Y11DRAFT_312053 [Daldinia sp. FL1419]|nr:hypothetical protein F5Y11DRAFT_312053 [Daldinia sp. FL1419]
MTELLRCKTRPVQKEIPPREPHHTTSQAILRHAVVIDYLGLAGVTESCFVYYYVGCIAYYESHLRERCYAPRWKPYSGAGWKQTRDPDFPTRSLRTLTICAAGREGWGTPWPQEEDRPCIHIPIHMPIYIYLYIYMCVCVCVYRGK